MCLRLEPWVFRGPYIKFQRHLASNIIYSWAMNIRCTSIYKGMRYGQHLECHDVLYDSGGGGWRRGCWWGVRMCLWNNEKGCDVIDNRQWMRPGFHSRRELVISNFASLFTRWRTDLVYILIRKYNWTVIEDPDAFIDLFFNGLFGVFMKNEKEINNWIYWVQGKVVRW